MPRALRQGFRHQAQKTRKKKELLSDSSFFMRHHTHTHTHLGDNVRSNRLRYRKVKRIDVNFQLTKVVV